MWQEKRSSVTLVIGADMLCLARQSPGSRHLSQLSGEGHLVAVLVSVTQERLSLATAISSKGRTKPAGTSSDDLASGWSSVQRLTSGVFWTGRMPTQRICVSGANSVCWTLTPLGTNNSSRNHLFPLGFMRAAVAAPSGSNLHLDRSPAYLTISFMP